MLRLTAFLAKLIGLYCILVALSMFVRKDAMLSAVAALFQDPPALMLAGVMAIGVGLAIVLSHNRWREGALATVVTLVGWLSLIKGLILLSLPPDAQVGYFAALHYEQYIYLYAAITLALGIYLTYGGFAIAPRPD